MSPKNTLHPLHKFDPVIRIFRITEHRQFMHLQIFSIIKSIEKRLSVALRAPARECAFAQQQDAQDLPECSGCLCGGLRGVRASVTTQILQNHVIMFLCESALAYINFSEKPAK